MTSATFQPTPRVAHGLLRGITIGLVVFTIAMAAKGMHHAWMLDGDVDMRSRFKEYSAFRQGIYPNRSIETHIPADVRVPTSVYPPYALPMFALFFEPFGKLQGRIVLELLSLLSLIAMAVYGHRLLRDRGPAAARLGAVAALAISGNGNSLALGQFSILCAGALLMQIVALERRRPLAAGAWWAVAMLKPQIGLAFAGLFLARREWRGLAFGLAMLVVLSLVACWWTEVSPLAIVRHWTSKMNMQFAATSSMPGRVAEAIGVQPRVLHLGCALLAIVVPLFAPKGTATVLTEPLRGAGLASILGGTLLYHLFYDNVMMFPLLFVGLAAAARSPTLGRLAIAAMLGLSLWIPEQLIGSLPYGWLVRPVTWIVCSTALVAVSRKASVSFGDRLPDRH